MTEPGLTQTNYRVCSRCVMDTSAIDITFDSSGVCNYCTEYLSREHRLRMSSGTSRDEAFGELVAQVKKAGRGKPYDCIMGVSGGVDSSYALVLAVKAGIRPLAVHMDNGWNSELAQSNIENLIRALNVDLYTYVIDWEEYRGLMQTFFDADVIDVELLYDNAMLAVNYRQARKIGTPYILAGTNFATEGMRMPSTWNWFKYDKKNIRNLGRKLGGIRRLKSFPAMGVADLLRYRFLHRISWVSFLDFTNYSKAEALEILQADFAYKPYPYKHYESVFTRFYQGYLLPEKFGVDKRRIHLSTLIISGEMTREEAITNLDLSPYLGADDLARDKKYFLKKMNWTEQELNDYLARSEVAHEKYGSEKWQRDLALKVKRIIGNRKAKTSR